MKLISKILITGSTGLLGSSLSTFLKKKGYEVITHGNTKKAEVVFDLTDQTALLKNLESIKPLVIINLVALTNVELCETNVNLAYTTNTKTVENIVTWMLSKKTNCHLIQISTDHVYDKFGLNSENNVNITNNYALTKYAGELACASISSTVLRTNFVGKSNNKLKTSFTDWIYRSLKTNEKIKAIEDITFSPLSISQLLDSIDSVLRSRPKGVFNLGSNKGMSKADFIIKFAESLNFSTNNIVRINSNEAEFLTAYRSKGMCMDVSKYESEFGLKLPELSEIIEQLSGEYNESCQ